MKHLLANSPASLENLKEARATFEREMARIAARKRSSADLARLSEILERAGRRRSPIRPASAASTDASTARSRRSAGNPIFTALIDALFRWLADFHVDLVSVPGLEQLTLAEHHQILDSHRAR